MPAGFAPMLGIGGVFTPAAVTGGSAPTVMKTAPAVAARETTAVSGLEASGPVAEEKGAARSPVAAPPAPVPSSAANTAPSPPVVPRIINRPDAGATQAPTAVETVMPKSSLSRSQSPPQRSAAAEAHTLAKPAETNPQDRAAEETPNARLLFGAVKTSTATLAGILGLVALLLVTFAFVRMREGRMRERTQLATVGPHFASASLATQWPLAEGAIWQRDRQRQVMTAPTVSSQGATSPVWADTIPRTRAEALQVLGMGISADGNVQAIKKIVDGLRLSWHPDRARDADDRQVRELRLKQINAAWEIIAGKRAEG
jgi:hypothetical protein